MTGAEVAIAGLGKAFGTTRAVDDVEISLPAGSFTALLGPSGCGKSTLLALVAGLLAPDSGSVSLDGVDVTAQPAERRPIGIVFQKPLLFPHLTVAQNVAFGLRMRREPRATTRRSVAAMLEQVQLAGFADRRVGEMSGGQEQRVALARTLVLQPRVLLLDEPFSQLDAQLREEMRALVRDLARERGLTTVFVTHDQGEAVEIADTIALMLDGRVVGHRRPQGFYEQPPSLAAARFFGVTNELAGAVVTGTFAAAGCRLATTVDDGPAVLVVRPESVRLADRPDAALRLSATITAARFAGAHVVVELTSDDGTSLRAHVPTGSGIEVGAAVLVTAAADACTVFAR